MASQITSGSQMVSLLSTTATQSATGTRNRDAGSSGFSDMLRSQMRTSETARQAQSGTERPKEKQADGPSASDKPRAAESQQDSTSSSSAAEEANDGAASAEASGGAEKAGDETTTQATTDAASTQDTADADDGEAAQTADPGTNIAGLPAEIAALLPAATTAARAATTQVAAGDGGTDLTGKIVLTGDTQGKALQNSADSQTQAALNFAQADGKSIVAAPLLIKPEAASGFAERAATALNTISADVTDGSPTAFLHNLRHPGQVTSSTPQLAVNTPAGQSAWAEEVGNRVTWMLGRAESKAELVLTPPHLGKVEVSINLNGDQTTAQFVAATQAARDALEQAMPKLREILAQSGISLGQTNVSTSGEQQASGEDRGRRSGRSGEAGAIDAAASSAGMRWTKQVEGLVDTFA